MLCILYHVLRVNASKCTAAVEFKLVAPQHSREMNVR